MKCPIVYGVFLINFTSAIPKRVSVTATEFLNNSQKINIATRNKY